MSTMTIDVGYDRKDGYWVSLIMEEQPDDYYFTFDNMGLCNEFYGFAVKAWNNLSATLPDQPEDRLRLFEAGLERAYEALTGTVTEPEPLTRNLWDKAKPLAENVASVYGLPYTGPVAPDKPDRAIPVAAGAYVVPPGPPLTGQWNPDAEQRYEEAVSQGLKFCWVCEETHPLGSNPHKEDR